MWLDPTFRFLNYNLQMALCFWEFLTKIVFSNVMSSFGVFCLIFRLKVNPVKSVILDINVDDDP